LWWTSGIVACTSAGVLPYASKCGTVYFLIGKEPNGLWADFGGRAELHDGTTKNTASREFSEETRYVYGKYELNKNLKKFCGKSCKRASIAYIKSHITGVVSHPRGYYKMFLAEVDYIPAKTFKHAAKIPHYEKKDYAWVPADKFLSVIRDSQDRLQTYFGVKHIRQQFVDTIQTNYRKVKKIISY
jgi:hypothetical protein